MSMPIAHPSDPNRPEGQSIRAYQMHRRFPKGSYARIVFDPREGQIVQIGEAVTGLDVEVIPMRFNVLINPFGQPQHRKPGEIKMRCLESLNAMEVLVEACK